MGELHSAILGALIGIVLTEIYQHLTKSWIQVFLKKFFLKSRRELYRNKRITSWIENYYDFKGNYDNLFDCEIGTAQKKILFLTNEKWSNLDLDIYKQDILRLDQGQSMKFKTNMWMISVRRFLGQRLFNADSLYLYSATSADNLVVRKCKFYEKLTYIDSLERETHRCSRYKRICKPRIRDTYFSSFDRCVSQNRQPMSIGCHVACVITIDGKRLVCIERRSTETFTYGGYFALLPVFGLMPIPNDSQGNILLFNIIKEYCEELYNINELERAPVRADPFWFYKSLPQAQQLLECLEKQTAFCKYLGYGVDAVNGMGVLSVLLYVTDEKVSKSIYEQNIANWEVSSENTKCGIQFVPIDDPSLAVHLEENDYQNASAITLDLAIKHLQKSG